MQRARPAMERLGGRIREADAFLFVTGEYNWKTQPGLKNLTDHFLEEWFWRPPAIASYFAGLHPVSLCLKKHIVRDLDGSHLEYAQYRNDRTDVG